MVQEKLNLFLKVMNPRQKRVEKVLEGIPKKEEKLAEILQVSRQAVAQRLTKDKEIDSISFIEAVSTLTGSDHNWLLFGGEYRTPVVTEPVKLYVTQNEEVQELQRKLIICYEETNRLKRELDERNHKHLKP